jgi:carboxypeptidase C (cathepsin A)
MPSHWLVKLSALLSLLAFFSIPPCLAQFPRVEFATNLTQIVSPVDARIRVNFKVPQGACKTAFESQQQYTGWVNVPGVSQTNLFFWFVAAREPTSLLTIWLNGGPGSSSMFGLFTEVGPCEVIEKGADRLDTAAREWGWDRASNMLFIDQVRQLSSYVYIPEYL